MAFDPGPQLLKIAISNLVSLRGLARRGAQADLERIWAEVAGPELSRRTKAVAVRRGVLQVSVADAPLLSQLMSYQKQEILERCIYPMINEGAKILEEKIAIRPSDIDVVWVNGYNWPVYRGGPMHYADQMGLKNVVAKLEQFQKEHGDAFKPAPLLEKLAAEGKTFASIR